MSAPRFGVSDASTLARVHVEGSHIVTRLVSGELLAAGEAGGYEFDDPLFRRWIQGSVLPELGIPAPPLF